MSPNFLAKGFRQTTRTAKGCNSEKTRVRIQVAKETARPGFFEKLGSFGFSKK